MNEEKLELIEEKSAAETAGRHTSGEAAEENKKEMKRCAERDFDSEIRELIGKYPELRGRNLPDEVLMAALDGMDMIEAYEAYRNAGMLPENGRHGRSKGVERQNENAAVRAPVRGVSGGAAVRAQGEDDFLRGFNADN